LQGVSDLKIGNSFKQVNGSWWVIVPKFQTMAKATFEERRVHHCLNDAIEAYITKSRPVLMKSGAPTNSLWISSRTGQQYTTKNLGTLISKITLQTIGVDVSPHLFRTAAATTAALYGGSTPHLASAVLGHHDPRITAEHYIRATSINAAKTYAKIARQYQSG